MKISISQTRGEERTYRLHEYVLREKMAGIGKIKSIRSVAMLRATKVDSWMVAVVQGPVFAPVRFE